ncbi:MAG: nucleoside monophosphate kinase [Planctomycetota bacterium]
MDNGQTNGIANGHVLEDAVPPPAEPYKAILLFGPPGSGKGTQGRILSAIPGFFHSATGDIFRSLDLQSHAGRVFWEYASHGELVPDEFTIDVWRQFIRGMEMINQFHPETELLILDGVPRSVRQAKLLEDTIEVVRIIHLKADFEKMVERLKRRAFKENRVDDAKDDVIRRRMRVYEETTRPLLDHYDDDLVVEIDATQSQIRVLERIIEMLVPLKEKIDAKTGDSFVAPNAPLPAATV